MDGTRLGRLGKSKLPLLCWKKKFKLSESMGDQPKDLDLATERKVMKLTFAFEV